MSDFPPNNPKAAEARSPKKVEQVTTAGVVRRRQPLGKRFANTFFKGDAPKTALSYAFENVVAPSIREMISEAGKAWIDKVVLGDNRHSRRGAPPSSPYGRVDYTQQSRLLPQRNETREPSRGSRARHDFGEIVIQSRVEADEVLSSLFDILNQYDMVLVADLYSLVGIAPTHVDHKWGWTELGGAKLGRVRGGGYLLDLPAPVPLSR